VNDTLGHPIGDALLQMVARRLNARVRETDIVARLGGDEFAVVQLPIDKPSEAVDFAERLIAMFDEPLEVNGHQVVIGTSIGIAFAPQDGLDADELLKNADLALNRAKFDGRGVYRLFHTAMDADMRARRLLELDLRQALRGDQFEVYYQPLVDLRTQAVSGFEALLRWNHPERGMVSPGQFIPLAEEIGVIVPIGEWVLRQACAAAASWEGRQSVSVNLSPVQFKGHNVVASVAAALHEARLDPGRLELEITETVVLQDTEATLATLHELRNLGVSIAMDDFGTGYSSLSYLRRFPFDRIKIDQSFVREIGKQRDCGAIIRAVIALSHEFGMATTAEGVETREQLCALAQAGCSDIQGYLFSRPVRLQDIPAALRSMPLVADLLSHASLAA
jgi:diguanylate cyclase (GGDEF)-like protein